MPSFYHGPQLIQDIINQSIGKVLDQIGIEHNLFRRWGSKPEEATQATSAIK